MRYANNGRGLHPRHGSNQDTRLYYMEGPTPPSTVVSFGVSSTSTAAFKYHSGTALLIDGLVGSAIQFGGGTVMVADGWSEMVTAFQAGSWTMSSTFRLTDIYGPTFKSSIVGYWGDVGAGGAANNGQARIFTDEYGQINFGWTGISDQETGVQLKPYQWYNVTLVGTPNGSNTDVKVFVNGALMSTKENLARPTGGSSAGPVIAGVVDGAGNGDVASVDICGVYFYTESKGSDWVSETSRRAFSLETNGCIATKVEVDTPVETLDFSDLEGENWIKSGTIEEDIDNDLAVADIELFKNADRKSLSPLNKTSDLNNATALLDQFTEALLPNYPIRIYFARHSKSDLPRDEDWVLRFEGKIEGVNFASEDIIKVSCVDKGGELLKASVTGFKKLDESAVVAPKYGIQFFDENGIQTFNPATEYGDTSKTVLHQEAIQQILNDHDNAEETGIVTKLQSIPGESTRPAIAGSFPATTLSVDVGENAYLKRKALEGQPILTAINAIALENGRRVFYKWNNQFEEYRLTYYEPKRENTPIGVSLNPINIQSVSSGTISIENVRNDIRITFPLNDTLSPATVNDYETTYPQYDWEVFGYAQTSPDVPSTAFIRVSSPSSISKYGRLFMQTGDSLTPGISQQEEAERLALFAIQDLGEADLIFNVETINTFEIEVDDYVQLEPDHIEISESQLLAVKSTVISFDDSSVSQSLAMFGKPGLGSGRVLSFEVLPGVTTQPLINPSEPVVNIPTQNAISNVQTTIQNQILAGVSTEPVLIGDGQAVPLDINISGDAGNNLAIGTDDGLYVPTGATTVSTTNSISGDGSGGSPLAVVLSADGGNNIVLGADGGIYTSTVGATVSGDDTINGDGSVGDPLSVNISSDAGNNIVLGGDGGIHVGEISVVSDTSITGTGTTASPLSVKVSADGGNNASVGGDGGVFVGEVAVVTDNSIDGVGTTASQLSVNISSDANNNISYGTDGGIYGNSTDPDQIKDTDGDTRFETERTPDNDTAHIVCDGTDVAKFTKASTTIQNVSGSENAFFLNAPQGFIHSVTSSIGNNTVFSTGNGLNIGSKSLKYNTIYNTLTDGQLTGTALTADSGEVVLRNIGVDNITDGDTSVSLSDNVGVERVNVALGGVDVLRVQANIGVIVGDSIMPNHSKTAHPGRSYRVLRTSDSNQNLIKIPHARHIGHEDLGNSAPTSIQARSEYLLHTLTSPLSYSLPSSGNVIGDWVRVMNRSGSSHDLTVNGKAISPGSFLDFEHDGTAWIIERDNSGSSGGGPFSVEADVPSPGDFYVEDNTSGNYFVIPASSFQYGNAAIQAGVDANAANIATNTADIATNASSLSSHSSSISTNASNIADLVLVDEGLQDQIDALIVSGGGGGGPFTVSLNDPATGDVKITDTTSGQWFVIPESMFIQGNSAIQSQVTTNAGNIATNTANIATNASGLSSHSSSISTNASNIALLENARDTRARSVLEFSLSELKLWGTTALSGSTKDAQMIFNSVEYDNGSGMTLQFAEGGASDTSGGAYYTAPVDGWYRYDIYVGALATADEIDIISGSSSLDIVAVSTQNFVCQLVKNGTFTRADNISIGSKPVGWTYYDEYEMTTPGTIVDRCTPSISDEIYAFSGSSGSVSFRTAKFHLTGEVLLSSGDRLSVVNKVRADDIYDGKYTTSDTSLVIIPQVYEASNQNKFEIICVQKT